MTLECKFLFLNNLNVTQLKKYNKILGIKGYSKLRKKELLLSIKKYIATKIIQKWYRYCKAYNDTCILSLEKIRYPCWPYKLENGWFYYNLPNLVDYFISSGCFKDPYTNKSMKTKELISIDNYMKKVNIKRKSLILARKNKEYYRKKNAREGTIETTIEEIRDIICLIRERLSVSEIEDSIFDIRFNLDNIYYPTLRYYINLLNKISKRRLKASFVSWINILEDTKSYDEKEKIRICVINWLNKEKKNYIK